MAPTALSLVTCMFFIALEDLIAFTANLKGVVRQICHALFTIGTVAAFPSLPPPSISSMVPSMQDREDYVYDALKWIEMFSIKYASVVF